MLCMVVWLGLSGPSSHIACNRDERVTNKERRKIWRLCEKKRGNRDEVRGVGHCARVEPPWGFVGKWLSETLLSILLLIGGVEQNPGPVEGRYSGWSRELDRWLWAFITTTEMGYAGRVKQLVKYFDLSTSGGTTLARVVAEISEASSANLTQRYYVNGLGEGNNFTEAHRWSCLRARLTELLPPPAALDVEKQMAAMKKDKSESLRQFVSRYVMTASSYPTTELDPQRAAHILYRKLPHEMQKALAVTKFQNCSLQHLEARVSTYMNWTSVSPAPWKSHLEDYMDIDGIRMSMMDTVEGMGEISEVEATSCNKMGSFRRNVLQGDKILFKNIDGPRSLMTAWKKLITTSSQYRDESRQFLQRQQQNWFSASDSKIQSADNEEGQDEGEEFLDAVDVLHDEVDILQSTDPHSAVVATENAHTDIVHEPEELFISPAQPRLDNGQDCTFLSIHAMDSPMPSHGEDSPVQCLKVNQQKNSLHVPIWIGDRKLSALVDTGATHCFVQKTLLQELNLLDQMVSCNKKVIFGNGTVDALLGQITLSCAVGLSSSAQLSITFYVLHGKGPSIIMGFPFLRDHGFRVDCENRCLVRDAEPPVRCFNTQVPGLFSFWTETAQSSMEILPGQQSVLRVKGHPSFAVSGMVHMDIHPELARTHGLQILSTGFTQTGHLRAVLHNAGKVPCRILSGQVWGSGFLWPSLKAPDFSKN